MERYGEILDIEEMRKAVREYDKREREADKGRELGWWERVEAVPVFERMEAAGYCERVDGFVRPLPEQWKWCGTLAAWSFMACLMADKIGMESKSGRTPYKKIAEAFENIGTKERLCAKKYKWHKAPKDEGIIRTFFQ